jgi:putative endopeptidase
MKKMISMLLALSLILSICILPAAAAGNEDYLTRGALEEMLRTAADDYNGGQTSGIIQGYEDGSLHYDAKVTRIEALVMMRRAFDPLPSRESNRFWSWIADEGVAYSDVPDWAVQDVNAMITAGLLANHDDGQLGAGDYITRTEADQLLRRVWMLFGTNPKDDFYMAREKGMLEQVEIYPGETGGGAFCDVQQDNQQRLDALLSQVLAGTWPAGSDEQKVQDLYSQALAVYTGEYADIGPIQGYLKALDEAASLTAILDVLYAVNQKMGLQAFMNPQISADCADSTKNVLWLAMDYSDLELSQLSDNEILKAARTYYQTLLLLSGDSAEEAAAGADAMIAYKKALAEIQLTPEEVYDVDLYYNVVSFADADARLVHLDLGAYLKALDTQSPTAWSLMTRTCLLTCATSWRTRTSSNCAIY